MDSSLFSGFAACSMLFSLTLSQPATEAARFTQKDLRVHVERLSRSGKLPLPEPKFDWEGETVIYALPHIFNPNPGNDLYEVPLHQQLVVESIRKYRMENRRQKQFWSRVLEMVEVEIGGMLTDIQNSEKNEEAVVSKLATRTDRVAKSTPMS